MVLGSMRLQQSQIGFGVVGGAQLDPVQRRHQHRDGQGAEYRGLRNDVAAQRFAAFIAERGMAMHQRPAASALPNVALPKIKYAGPAEMGSV